MIYEPEIAVIGASLGGVLAAWRAAQAGRSVLLAAEHAWIGGQMSAQAVPPDEHLLIEHGGASSSYRRFRDDIRRHYRGLPGFIDHSAMTPGLTNPGDGWVSRLCFEPVLAARWFEMRLRDAGPNLKLLRLCAPFAAERDGPRIERVLLRGHDGRVHTVRAQVFIDATDTGELLRLAQLPYRVGKEARAEFDEPDAPTVADRLDQQPVTHVMALRRHSAPGPVATAPPSYAAWRTHRLPHHGHLLFSTHLPGRGRRRGESASLPFEVSGASERLDWWRYRRIVSRAQWDNGRNGSDGSAGRTDVTLVNWAQNDYALHPLLDGPVKSTAQVSAAARELSLCFLHWLHTEAGLVQWQPAADVLGTPDGLAQQTYVRESRRIVAHTTLSQTDMQRRPEPGAVSPDAVGIGWYNLDIHPTCVSGHGVNAAVEPFVLPLGAFVPLNADNLLPGCKNIGVTHLANACTRVHPVEWLVGEVAGLIAATLVERGLSARALPGDLAATAALHATLRAAGIPLAWSAELLARRPASH